MGGEIYGVKVACYDVGNLMDGRVRVRPSGGSVFGAYKDRWRRSCVPCFLSLGSRPSVCVMMTTQHVYCIASLWCIRNIVIKYYSAVHLSWGCSIKSFQNFFSSWLRNWLKGHRRVRVPPDPGNILSFYLFFIAARPSEFFHLPDRQFQWLVRRQSPFGRERRPWHVGILLRSQRISTLTNLRNGLQTTEYARTHFRLLFLFFLSLFFSAIIAQQKQSKRLEQVF